MSVCLRTKWLWIRIPLLSLKLQVWRLLQARSYLTFRQTIECRFTLKLVRDMMKTYRQAWKFALWLLVLSLVYKVSAKNVEKSYLSWNWRVIQTLKRNWLFVWKMTWEIWCILMRAVENLKIYTFMGFFCRNVCNVCAKKIQRSCVVKNDLWFQKFVEFSRK